MEHKLWYDAENEIMCLEFTRDLLTSDLELLREKMYETLEGKPYRQLIIGISKTNKVENRETRELANKMFQEAEVSDVAFVGGSAANRMIAKVLMKTGAIKTKGEFFKNHQDAINWIINRR